MIGDPHGIDNPPSVNDNLGYFLDCLGLRPLSDARYSRVSIDEVDVGNDIRLVRSSRKVPIAEPARGVLAAML